MTALKSTINQPFNPDPREGDDFFLNHPQKLDNPFPDFQYFRENHPIFFYSPLNQWFVFKYNDVAELFSDSRLSPNRMKGFVDLVPEEVCEDMRQIGPYLKMWIMAKDGQAHTRLHDFLHLGFNTAVAHGLKEQTQKSADELLDQVEAQGYMDGSGDYGFLLTAYVLSDFLGVRKEDRYQVIQWSMDFVDFFNIIPIAADTTRRLVQSANGLIEYTRELIAQRRVKPQDDFLSTLVKAQAETAHVTAPALLRPRKNGAAHPIGESARHFGKPARPTPKRPGQSVRVDRRRETLSSSPSCRTHGTPRHYPRCQ